MLLALGVPQDTHLRSVLELLPFQPHESIQLDLRLDELTWWCRRAWLTGPSRHHVGPDVVDPFNVLNHVSVATDVLGPSKQLATCVGFPFLTRGKDIDLVLVDRVQTESTWTRAP